MASHGRKNRTSRVSRARRLTLDLLESRVVPALFTGSSQVNSEPLPLPISSVTSVNASSANGQSVVVWTQAGVGGKRDILMKVYNTNRVGTGPTKIVAQTANDEFEPSVSMDDFGRIIVAWTTQVSATNTNVLAARFSNLGVKVGPTFTVAGSSQKESQPSVAAAGSGSFLIAFTYGDDDKMGIKIGHYSSKAVLQTTTIVIAPTTSRALRPDLDRNARGQFVVGYQVLYNVYLKRYSSTGTVVGVHTIDTQVTLQHQFFRPEMPSVAIDNAGNSVVAWVSGRIDPQFNAPISTVLFRTISQAGVVGRSQVVEYARPETIFERNTFHGPDVAMNRKDGDFALAYGYHHEDEFGKSESVNIREFNSRGVVLSQASYNVGSYDFDPAGGGNPRSTVQLPSVSISGTGYITITSAVYDQPGDPSDETDYGKLIRHSGRNF